MMTTTNNFHVQKKNIQTKRKRQQELYNRRKKGVIFELTDGQAVAPRKGLEEKNKEYVEKLRIEDLPMKDEVLPEQSPNRSMSEAKLKARTDILNVIKVHPPCKEETRRFDKPDINKLINRGMTSSLNIGKEMQMQVYGKVTDSKVPPPGNKLKIKKLDRSGLAGVGFDRDFK